MTETEYIVPNFLLVNDYQELLKAPSPTSDFRWLEKDESRVVIELSDLVEHNLVFIVAEPGQGKTRLLSEINKRISSNESRTSYIIDLKTKHDNETIADWLIKKGVSSSETTTLLLDGLDEVPVRGVLKLIDELVSFIKTTECQFFISSRIHYFSKYVDRFTELKDAEYLLIKPLQRSQVRAHLKNFGLVESNIETLFKSLSFDYDRVSVLQNPRYLNMIASQILKGSINPKLLNRSILFETFVIDELLLEDTKSGRQLAQYKKRFLEMLALTMEIAQVKVINEDNLLDFIDSAKSDIKLTLLGQIEIEELYDHSLIKTTNQQVSFVNAEIQEYLAAKCLMRMGNSERKVFDLSIEPNLREIIPSWLNTLSFIIDEHPSVARGILDLKPNRMSLDRAVEKLITGSTSAKLSAGDKKYIFDYLWSMNNAQARGIDYDVSFNLANYIQPDSIESILKSFKALAFNPKNTTKAVNIIVLIGNCIKLQKLNSVQLNAATEKLIRLALNSNNEIVQHNAIHGLYSLRDVRIIDRLATLADNDSQLVLGSLESLAYEIDRNYKTTIDIFVKGMHRNDLFAARRGLEELDTVNSITYFLDHLKKDANLLKITIDHDRLFTSERSEFVDNIKKLWKNEWLQTLKKIVINAFDIDHGYYAEKSDFIRDLMYTIKSRSKKSYFRELVDNTLEDSERTSWYRFEKSLAEIISIEDVRYLVDKIKSNSEEHMRLFRIFSFVLYSNNPDGEIILKEARSELASLFKEYDKQNARLQQTQELNSLTYRFNEQYEDLLSDDRQESWNAMVELTDKVVQYLSDESTHKERLEYTTEQIDTVWSMLKERLLDIYDPADTKLKLNKDTPDSRSYQITAYTPLFEKAVLFGYLTKRDDLGAYREKLISLVPYSNYFVSKAVFSVLISLSPSEMDKIIEPYIDTESDRAKFNPDNLIEFAERFKIKSALGILEKLVESDINIYDKIKALSATQVIGGEPQYLKAIFDKHSLDSNKEEFALALKANEFLIKYYEDNASIVWRFEYLKSAAFEHTQRLASGFYDVSPGESEIHSKSLLKPLFGLKDKRYIDLYIDLLRFSIDLYSKGPTWHSYAKYLWEAHNEYLSGLVLSSDYKVITTVENVLSEYDPEYTAEYLDRLNAVKIQYLESLGKEKSYRYSIGRLNEYLSDGDMEVSSNADLYELILSSVDELDRWINQEGIKMTNIKETPIQRNVKIMLDNILLRRGFRENEIHLIREPQAVDETRTDFLVYYGFLGPIVIEIKASGHAEIKSGKLANKKSYVSMKKYMNQYAAQYGIFLVYDSNGLDNEAWTKFFNRVKNSYENIPGVAVRSLRNIT